VRTDHYRGISSKWNAGAIVCTPVTKALVLANNPNIKSIIKTVRIGGPPVNIEGVEVLAIDANHCPGSCMFLFTNHRSGEAMLHTGDFRALESMYSNVKELRRLRGGGITCLHLDTTYLSPTYVFPDQSRVLAWVGRAVSAFVQRYQKCLVCVGAYYIGKERIHLAIASTLRVKLYVDKRRAATIRLLDWPELEGMLTDDPRATNVHVVGMGALSMKSLMEHKARTGNEDRDVLLAIRPTGWAHSKTRLEELQPKWSGAARYAFLGVPYSEHSSFVELQRFVRWLKPLKVLPHVNVGDQTKRDEQDRLIRPWIRPTSMCK